MITGGGGGGGEAERVAALRERAWRETAAIDAEFAAGRLDEAGWHAAMAELVRPAYLAAATPYAQAGHSGDAAVWEASRGLAAAALDRSGCFLDVGCASGVLMESVVVWGQRRGFDIEPWGLEIVPELAALARRRLPAWAARIEVGNVRHWRPSRTFDYALLRPEYAPPGRQATMYRHVLDAVLGGRGRLIVFAGTEAAERRRAEDQALAAGLAVAGRIERVHPEHDGLRRRVFWIDGPDRGQHPH
jgi:hypothetical protein